MKNWTQFLLCLIIAGCISFVHNMSSKYTDIVNVHVIAVSDIVGHANESGGSSLVAARCSASGFKLFSLARAARRGKTVKVEMSPDIFKAIGKEEYSVNTSDLIRYAGKIFGDDVRLESFVTTSVDFRFKEEQCRRLPVVAVQDISYRSQYMATEPLALTPDSVMVYGDPQLLSRLDRVITEPLRLSDVSASKHGELRITAPAKVRVNQTKVAYSLNVSRYVEMRTEVKVEVRGLPSGRKLAVYPPTVSMVARSVFPSASNVNSLRAYVNYRDFVESVSGTCMIHAEATTEGLISVETQPQTCEVIDISAAQ